MQDEQATPGAHAGDGHALRGKGRAVSPAHDVTAKTKDEACLIESLADPNAELTENDKATPVSPMRLILEAQAFADVMEFVKTLKQETTMSFFPVHLVLAAGLCAPLTAGEQKKTQEPEVRRYVAPDGKPDNPGTAESPWDIHSALGGRQKIAPGTVVLLAGGSYRHPDRSWESPGFTVDLAGEPERPIHIRPVPGERVTLDGKVQVWHNSRHVWLWDLELTVSETAKWNRQVTSGGAAVDGSAKLPQGGLNILGGVGCKFIHLVVHDMHSGVGLWRPAVDAEMHGCLIYGIGSIGPDRYHGPGIYTQNESGTKEITDNILFGNYSTTIQAYGSSNAEVSGFNIEGNIAFAPVKEGARQRILIGGGRPSRRIRAASNLLYEVPLEIGYTAPSNEDASVVGNRIVGADLVIKEFRQLEQRDNLVLGPHDKRPDRPSDVILRPSRHTPGRANLAIFNWSRGDAVSVDLAPVLAPGQRFRIVNVLDYYGKPVCEGVFEGKPVSVPISKEPRTGDGEFCAFVVIGSP